jgi:FemAB-related protein (PEP-CTERM system-associated)
MDPAVSIETAPPWTLDVRSRASADWDSFLLSRPEASIYLRSGWSELIRDVFGHEVVFIEARESNGALAGVLPLVRQKSLLIGDFATSVPFFNYGGAECDDDALAQQLMIRARSLAEQWGCSYVEFRDARPHGGGWIERRDKVSMILKLPPTFEALSKQLGSKLRSQVKRTDRENPSVRIGDIELIGDFYEIFAENMRDLGTPVYPKRFFEALVRRFPQFCRVLIVYSNNRAAAGAFLIIADGRAEIPWASCRAKAKPLGFNMKLYWEVLRHVVDSKCTDFDFGRSTVDAGTYRFKKQWGAEPVQLFWHRWERKPQERAAEGEATRGGVMDLGPQIWRKLPLPIANTLGPWLSPKLPW